jgi:hypothetical protein
MDDVLINTVKVMGAHSVKWGSKTFLDLDFTGDLSILYEIVRKMNEVLRVL